MRFLHFSVSSKFDQCNFMKYLQTFKNDIISLYETILYERYKLIISNIYEYLVVSFWWP